MNEHDEGSGTTGNEALSGSTARRKFLKQSGRMAVAAPAVVLLMSASSKAVAVGGYNGGTPEPTGTPTNPPR